MQHSRFVSLFFSLDFLQTLANQSLINFVERGEGSFFSAVLLLHLRQTRRDSFELGGQRVDGGLLLREVACHDQWLWDQVAGPSLVLLFASLVGLDDPMRLRL